MRVFLIIVSFINSLLYFAIYAYFETIMGFMGSSISGGLQGFIKILLLIIAGFCVGLIPMLMLAPGMKRSRMDIRNLVLVGVIPFILLVLSPGPVIDFMGSKIFSGNETIKELIFYLFSRQALWSLWLGFALGTSTRISFRKNRLRHAVSNTFPGNQVKQESQEVEEQDEGN